jgi:hypothetical protein
MIRSGVTCDADFKPERFHTARAFLFSADLQGQKKNQPQSGKANWSDTSGARARARESGDQVIGNQ